MICIFLILLLIGGYALYQHFKVDPLIKEALNSGDFSIAYICQPSLKPMREKNIDSNGYFTETITMGDEIIETNKGSIPIDKLKEFLKYVVIKKDFFNLPQELNAEGICDGRDIYITIRVGNQQKKVGGYEPSEVSNAFRSILSRYYELFGY